jgi:recombining binding protein (suppressor of hairless)
MTQQAWLSANPEREFGARAHSFGLSPRLPPLSEIGRLSSSPSYSTPRTLGREKRMLDYSSALGGQQQQGLYGQQDVSGDNASLDPRHAYGTQDAFAPNSHLHPSSSSQYGYHAYGHHSTPDLQRVRDNSSSSLNSQYGISSGAIYPHPQFASSQSSFSSTGSAPMYDVGNINSFATAKGPYPTNGESSLGYPGADHSSSFFSDTGLDRRGSNMSLGSSYDPSMQTTDYPIYSTPGMQLPPHIYSHEQPGSIDGIESIMPRVTNMLPDSVAMYDGLSLSSTPDPSPDMTMPSMDALLSDASFQQGVSSGDVELFMRPILEQYIRAPNRLAFGEKTIIVMSSKVAQKSYGTEKR